jgi:hypothetical protein
MIDGTTPAPRLVPPEAAFEEFKTYVQKFDPIELLCQLTMTFLFTPEGFHGEASDARRWVGELSLPPVTLPQSLPVLSRTRRSTALTSKSSNASFFPLSGGQQTFWRSAKDSLRASSAKCANIFALGSR